MLEIIEGTRYRFRDNILCFGFAVYVFGGRRVMIKDSALMVRNCGVGLSMLMDMMAVRESILWRGVSRTKSAG